VAILETESSFIVELDGVNLRSNHMSLTRLEVLPGEHSIAVAVLWQMREEAEGALITRFSIEPYMLCLKAEAGKTYLVRIEMKDKLLWRPQVFERRAPTEAGARTRYVPQNIATACQERRHVKTDYAVELYGALCSNGNAQHCFTLGDLYRDGLEVPQDEGRAATLFEKACDGGVALGCNSLGVLHRKGGGVPKDEGRAATLFDKACTGQVAQGCFNLGLQYMEGRAVARDEGRAATLFDQACTGQVAQGCLNLGVLYKEGRGVPKDEHRAAALFAAACEGGLSSACVP
jgi:hypothetical protein